MRGMGEDFSPALLSYKSYSPTRLAGWGLNPGLSTLALASHTELRCGFRCECFLNRVDYDTETRRIIYRHLGKLLSINFNLT